MCVCVCEYTTQEDIVSLDGDFALCRIYSHLSFGGYLHQQAHCSDDDGADYGSQKYLGKGSRQDGRVSGGEGQFPPHCLSTPSYSIL